MYSRYFVVFGVVFYLSVIECRAKNYVQWDDDELSDLAKELDRKQESKDSWSQHAKTDKRSTGAYRSNRLVYHGQIKHNGTLKVIDGIKLSINTHQPVQVNRDRYSLVETAPVVKPKQSVAWVDELAGWRRLTDTGSSNKSREQPEYSLVGQSELASSSDWRPITLVASRARRASKTQTEPPDVGGRNSSNKARPVDSSLKWKPIKKKPSSEHDLRRQEETSSQASRLVKTTELRRAGHSANDKTDGSRQASFEEPFDDEGLASLVVSEDRQVSGPLKMREPKSMVASSQRWTPVGTTTLQAPSASTQSSRLISFGPNLVTTTPSPATTTGAANGSSLELAAQKSASDLNYIYSSQPDRQPTGAGSSSYYSNYVIPQQPPPSGADSLQPVNQPIVDTVSGQTPEMISDRSPDERPPESTLITMPVGNDYSLPPTVAAFQPAQPPPSRPSYGAYEPQGYYSQPRLNRQLPASTSAPPLVRQEHHYHYYNPERQQTQQQPAATPPPTPVAREIQPIFISQPMLMQQQPSTSTQAPQIIREIIKEVAAPAPVQVQRIVLPQPPLIPVPLASRELGADYASLADQAQRMVRTISSQVPSIAAVRVPQIRLALPSLQVSPLRLASASPITRQTGSFIIPPMPQKTTTYLTETQAMPTHTTIMHTTQFTPATRTTVYTTDHQPQPTRLSSAGYRRRRRR